MADIKIVDSDGRELLALDSADEITIEGVHQELGKCTITLNGVTKSINTAWKLVPGTYLATAKRQAFSNNPSSQDDNESIRSLRKEVYELKCRDSKAMSYADYYQDKLKEGRIKRWDVPVLADPQIHLPEALKNWQSLEKGSERDVVKPCWKRLIQQSELLPGSSVGYEVGLLGTKIPDIAFYPSNVAKPRAAEYLAYGDCKGHSWSGKSLSELGQGIQYGHRILDANPLRSHVYGFFTNNSIVVLIQSTRSTERPCLVHWHVSGPLTFDQGMATFFLLVQTNSGYIKPPTVQGRHVTIRASLGQGRTCRAYLAECNGMEVVAKLYDCDETVSEDVRKIGEANAAMQPVTELPRCQIPTVQGSEGRWLLITPAGIPFTSNTVRQDHIRKLVSGLKIVHEAGIVHRDVRFANIFHLISDDSVLLNDWGASIRSESLEMVAGCPDQWAHPDIRGKVEAVPLPKHDLYSLVSSLGDLIAPGLSPEKKNSLLWEAFQAAETCNYDRVVELLVTLIAH